jgi:hypothetical protein
MHSPPPPVMSVIHHTDTVFRVHPACNEIQICSLAFTYHRKFLLPHVSKTYYAFIITFTYDMNFLLPPPPPPVSKTHYSFRMTCSQHIQAVTTVHKIAVYIAVKSLMIAQVKELSLIVCMKL